MKIINLKSGNMAIETPHYDETFRRCMNSINAEWRTIRIKGVDVKMWSFRPEHLEYAKTMYARIYAPQSEQPRRAEPDTLAQLMRARLDQETPANGGQS